RGRHRVLGQAASRRYGGHGSWAGGGRARNRGQLAAVDQLWGPAASDAAHDRSRPLSFRHQFPRIRGNRHCRGRRHRGDTQHRFRPFRIRFRCRHHHRHHRDRYGVRIRLRLFATVDAMTTIPARGRTWRRRDRRTQLLVWAGWLFAVALFVACFQLISERTIWAFVWDAPTQAADLGVRMVPPDWPYIRALGRPIWDTINIATIGTLVAVLLAIPVAYCAARNTTPSVGIVRPIALFIIVSSRSINALIWALMLVTIIGPGVFAGIIAIALRSIGFCAKLLYEAI